MNNDAPYQVFINYRKIDTGVIVPKLYDALKKKIGGSAVFLDKEGIEEGDNFPEVIKKALLQSDIVLVLIGPSWLNARDENHKKRLEKANDYVRQEIELAYAEGKMVWPVLFEEAKMPESTKLPMGSALCNLSNTQSKFAPIRENHAEQDIQPIVDKIFEKLADINADDTGHQPANTSEPEKEAGFALRDYYYQNLPAEPYLGIQPFREEHAAIFFGRDRDIVDFIHLIRRSHERISLLFGQSGVGKSSLLFAGLVPRIKDDFEVIYYRRNKDIGLAKGLDLIFSQSNKNRGQKPFLFILDQVEEMYTNPSEGSGKTEPGDFARALKRVLVKEEAIHDHFILGFRNEYFAQIRDLLHGKKLTFEEKYLKSLDKDDVLNAIEGVTKDKLYNHFKLDFERGLPEQIRNSILNNEDSHIAPLLQIQLKKLYEAAKAEDKNNPEITHQHYQQIWKPNLEALLDEQIRQLPKEQIESGLVLDVLHQFTTEQATATSRAEASLMQRYAHVNDFKRLLQQLKELSLLSDQQGTSIAAVRLAHDALAPLIRKRYHDSNAPAQNAWRLVDSKKNQIDASFGEYDLVTIDRGRNFMQVIPGEVEKRIDISKEEINRKNARIRDNNAFIFDTLQGGGHDLILQIEHAPAIDKFKAAINVQVPDELKHETLYRDLLELIFFFAKSNQTTLATKAVEVFAQLPGQNETTRQGIEKCLNERWAEEHLFSGLLKDINSGFFEEMTDRYYPEMIDVEGGTFKMGTKDYSWTRPVHKVKVSDFSVAQTPTTFYQYGLYCAASGKNIKNFTPPWGRKGDHPLVRIEWFEVMEYANWLSRHLGRNEFYETDKKDDPGNHGNYSKKWTIRPLPTNGFALPTNAEWEFAARGGKRSKGYLYSGSDQLETVGWFWKNSGDADSLSGEWDAEKIAQNNNKTHAVKGKEANELYLYDMSGNVWEWCWDWFGNDYYKQFEKALAVNPMGPEESEKGNDFGRVVRGGSWNYESDYCRVALRNRNEPAYSSNPIGFRLVRH